MDEEKRRGGGQRGKGRRGKGRGGKERERLQPVGRLQPFQNRLPYACLRDLETQSSAGKPSQPQTSSVPGGGAKKARKARETLRNFAKDFSQQMKKVFGCLGLHVEFGF